MHPFCERGRRIPSLRAFRQAGVRALEIDLFRARWSQDGPRWSQDGSKMTQDGPKMAPRWPKMAPRWPKKGPRGAQEGSQKGPKSLFQGVPTSKPKKGV